MTPEERQLLIDTTNRLNEFLDAYYKTNFPSVHVFTKDVDFKNKVSIKQATVETLTSKDVSITDSVGFFGVTPIDQEPAITKPTGGVTIDAESRTAINKIIDTLKNFGLTA